MYDVEKEKRLMAECNGIPCFTRPSLASLNIEEGEESEETASWEERIVRERGAKQSLWKGIGNISTEFNSGTKNMNSGRTKKY